MELDAPLHAPDVCRWTASCEGASGRTALARLGERLAAEHLGAVHGLDAVARNLRVAVEGLRGEIDVVMRDANSGALIVCEVKSRTHASGAGAVEAFRPAQQARIRRMTAALLATGRLRARGVRFDLVTLDVSRTATGRVGHLEHRADAW